MKASLQLGLQLLCQSFAAGQTTTSASLMTATASTAIAASNLVISLGKTRNPTHALACSFFAETDVQVKELQEHEVSRISRSLQSPQLPCLCSLVALLSCPARLTLLKTRLRPDPLPRIPAVQRQPPFSPTNLTASRSPPRYARVSRSGTF